MIKPNKILEKEVTRREFLVTSGAALFGLMSASTILGALTRDEAKPDTNTNRPGYGVSSYGP